MGDAFRRAESGTQLLARLEGRSSLKNLEPYLFAEEGSPVHGDVIEFHGPEGTGKTEMLYHLVARCITPKSGGGLEVEVIFIDTDYHFDMLRLVTVLEHRCGSIKQQLALLEADRAQLPGACQSVHDLLLNLPEALLAAQSSGRISSPTTAEERDPPGFRRSHQQKCITK